MRYKMKAVAIKPISVFVNISFLLINKMPILVKINTRNTIKVIFNFIFTALSIFIPFNYNLFIFLIKLYHILINFAIAFKRK